MKAKKVCASWCNMDRDEDRCANCGFGAEAHGLVKARALCAGLCSLDRSTPTKCYNCGTDHSASIWLPGWSPPPPAPVVAKKPVRKPAAKLPASVKLEPWSFEHISKLRDIDRLLHQVGEAGGDPNSVNWSGWQHWASLRIFGGFRSGYVYFATFNKRHGGERDFKDLDEAVTILRGILASILAGPDKEP